MDRLDPRSNHSAGDPCPARTGRPESGLQHIQEHGLATYLGNLAQGMDALPMLLVLGSVLILGRLIFGLQLDTLPDCLP